MKKNKKMIIFFSLILLFNTISFGKELSKTKCDLFCHLTKQLKYPQKREKALNELISMALEGDARASRKIGEIFIYGEYGFKRDCRKGLIFLLKALTKNGKYLYHGYDPKALKTIADMFKYGICVKKDEKKYKKYIERYYKEKDKFKY